MLPSEIEESVVVMLDYLTNVIAERNQLRVDIHRKNQMLNICASLLSAFPGNEIARELTDSINEELTKK